MFRIFVPAVFRCLLAALLMTFTARAQTVVEEPKPDSQVKLFEFAGGTPEQLMEKLKETFGSFGMPVMMEDKTNGEPLPPVAKMFALNAIDALQLGMSGRVSIKGGSKWIYLTFRESAPEPVNADPFAGSPEETEARKLKTIHFRFPGGTPAELVAALENAFGVKLAEITTIAPEVKDIRIPALNLKAGSVYDVLELLNKLSLNTAGTCGCWLMMTRTGEGALDQNADILMVTPLYDERNPPPAIVAIDSAGGGERRALREMIKKVESLEHGLHSANQALQEVRQELQALKQKNP